MNTDLSSSFPYISAIVPVYRDVAGITRCLQALTRQSLSAAQYEVIVADNEGSDEIAAVCRDFGVRRIVETRPGSYAARNAALGCALGYVFAFTDSDCRPHFNWLLNGATALVENSSAGIVGGRIRVVKQHPRRQTAAEHYDCLFAFHQRSAIEKRHRTVTANMFTTRSVVQAVGPFNDALMSGGDGEWSRRVSQAGFAIQYVDSAVVDHPPLRTIRAHVHKLRRTTAGQAQMYRQSPDHWSAFSTSEILRTLRPPIKRLRRLASDLDSSVSRFRKVQLGGILLLRRYSKLLFTVYYKIFESASSPRR